MASVNKLDYQFYLHCLKFAHKRYALEDQKYHLNTLSQLYPLPPPTPPPSRLAPSSQTPPPRPSSFSKDLHPYRPPNRITAPASSSAVAATATVRTGTKSHLRKLSFVDQPLSHAGKEPFCVFRS
jgi:hypothetical protein